MHIERILNLWRGAKTMNMSRAYKEALEKAKSEHLGVFNEEDFESGFKACWEFDRRGEAVAHMFPSDLKKFETSESGATAYSIPYGSPEEVTVPLFTHSHVAEQRELARLTDEESESLFREHLNSWSFTWPQKQFSKAIQDALIKKNESAPSPSVAQGDVSDVSRDPLQAAAEWLLGRMENPTIAGLQSTLLIGYNRASRLFEAAKINKPEEQKQ